MKNDKFANNYLLFFLELLFYEVIFVITLGLSLFDGIVIKLLFFAFVSFLFSLIGKICRYSKIYNIIVICLLGLFYIINYLYYVTYSSLLTFNTFINGFDSLKFYSNYFSIIKNNILVVLLMIIPLVIYLVFNKRIKIKFKYFQYIVIGLSVLFGIMLGIKYPLIKEYNNMTYVKYFGVFGNSVTDTFRYIFNYDHLNKNVKFSDDEISAYLNGSKITSKNKYTGLFKNKNLIFVVAESFNNLALNKDINPTLTEMFNHGFVFNNYYSPVFPVSTADGEYMLNTGILPAEGTWSIESSNKNYYPYTYAKSLGYKSFAFHNYDYDYYKRDLFLKNMGISNYLACKNGLEKEMNCDNHPNSDYEMFKASVGHYINEKQFFSYYVTMSSHFPYNKTNDMSVKNFKYVKNMDIKTDFKYYLASSMELDKAMKYLLDELKSTNKLDDTVIVLVPDHFPFALNDAYNTDEFTKYKSPFLIYNSKMDKIEVDDYGLPIDVLPTILNLFGVNYDSRLLIGKDINSGVRDYVFFSSRNWKDKNGYYISNNEKYYGVATTNYIKSINDDIYKQYRTSRLILESDYYKSVLNK